MSGWKRQATPRAASSSGSGVFRPARRTVLALVAVVVALVLLVALGVARPSDADAHAFLKTSEPPANAVVATAPAVVTLTFTEPLERGSTWARLYDQTGQEAPGASVRAGADDYAMILNLPPSLPVGTYTVLWHTLSTADGHTAEGYIPFTVGTQADVRLAAPPPVSDGAGPPVWLQTLSRWAALLGLAMTVAVWPVWLLVLRPAIAPAWQAGPALARRTKRLAAIAIGAAIGGSLVALIVQAAGYQGTGGFASDLRATLFETRYGRLWLLRIGLFLVYGAVLLVAAWWWPKRQKVLTAAGLLLAAALPIPFSLVSHAAAQPQGRLAAETFDVVHLLGASVWIGGLIVLLGAFVPSLKELTIPGRRVVLGRVVPRFSALALAAWVVMGLTGLYSAWLNVGNLEALRETAYGRSLTIKLLLIVPLLALGAFNLLVVGQGLRRAGREPKRVLAWSRHFAIAVGIEVALALVLLVVVGRLTSQAPAREELALSAGRAVIELDGDGRSATLTITPASTGPNHYRLEFGGGALPIDATAILRVELPNQGTGAVDVALARAAGNAFEGHGSELSIAGDWALQALLIQPGRNDWTASTTLAVGVTPPEVDLPAPAWRFGWGGVVGLLLLAAGAVGFAVAFQTGGRSLRRESLGLGTVATAIGLLLLLQARLPEASATLGGAPVLGDDAAIARGEALFLANCAACHGAGGQGDGPAAAGLTPPPADLTSSHARLHQDQDMFFWVENGIAGSAMPAFGGQLSDEEIWDALAYIRALQETVAASRDAPGPEGCTIDPRTIESLAALADPAAVATQGGRVDTAVGEGPRPTPAPGQPADPQTVAEITASVRQLIACSNARDALRRLALFTDDYLAPSFTRGPSDAFVKSVATPLAALPEPVRVAIVSIADVELLPDGRVRATVSVDNPTTHAHGPQGEELSGQQTLEVVVLVFAKVGDTWLIDGMTDLPPVQATVGPTTTPTP